MQNDLTLLSDWDGKATQYLINFYQNNLHLFQKDKRILLDLLKDPTLQRATSWLIKHHREQGNHFSPTEVKAIIQAAPFLQDWQAQLHLLQLLPYFNLEREDFEVLIPFIDQMLKSDNKFVRAWAYNGLAILTRFIPELFPETKLRFELGLQEEAASIKARIRKAIKEQELDIPY